LRFNIRGHVLDSFDFVNSKEDIEICKKTKEASDGKCLEDEGFDKMKENPITRNMMVRKRSKTESRKRTR